MTWSAGLCSASAPGDAAYTSRYKQMGSGIYKKCSRQTDVQCGWMEPLKAPFPLSLLFVLQVFVNVLVAQWSLATGANFAEDPWILHGKQEVDCPDPPPPPRVVWRLRLPTSTQADNGSGQGVGRIARGAEPP